MKKLFNVICKGIFAYSFTGGLYLLIEELYKYTVSGGVRHTDLTMYFLAGFIGIFIYFLNNVFTYDTDYLLQIFVCSFFATFCEGLFGNTYNLDYHIWDYSHLPFSWWNNQINLFFIFAWIAIVTVVIPILDYIDWKLFDYKPDTPPYYLVMGRKVFQFEKE